MLDLNKLNEFGHEILDGNLAEKYKSFRGDFYDSIQIESSKMEEEAFNLRRPFDSAILFIENSTPAPKDTIAILRVILPYTILTKIDKDKNQFNFYVHNVINNVLGSLTRRYGNLDKKHVQCKPSFISGSEEYEKLKCGYFRELETSAGFELRFMCRDL